MCRWYVKEQSGSVRWQCWRSNCSLCITSRTRSELSSTVL